MPSRSPEQFPRTRFSIDTAQRLSLRLSEADSRLPERVRLEGKAAGVIGETIKIEGALELDLLGFEPIGLLLIHDGNLDVDIEGGAVRKTVGRGGIVCLPPATPMKITLRNVDLTCIYLVPDLIPGIDTELISRKSVVAQFNPDDAQIVFLLSCVREELQSAYPCDPRFLETLALCLGHHIFRRYAISIAGSLAHSGGLAPRQLRRAQEMLQAAWEHVPLAALAREAGLSQSHFSRAFKRTTGYSPQQWARTERIKRARELIADRGRSLTSIASDLGFASLSHFSAAFKQATGLSPNRYRRDLFT